MKWPRPAGEPDQTPDRRTSSEPEETPSWLSSSDLASSPRPWERDDLVGLVESVATGEREIVAPPVDSSVDTPMYQQLRSERSEELPTEDLPDAEGDDAIEVAVTARSEAPVQETRSEVGSVPPMHGVSSVAPDPVADVPAVSPSAEAYRRQGDPAAFHAEPADTEHGPSDADRGGPDALRDDDGRPGAPESDEDAAYGTRNVELGRDTTPAPNGPQRGSSQADVESVPPGTEPFHVEHREPGEREQGPNEPVDDVSETTADQPAVIRDVPAAEPVAAPAPPEQEARTETPGSVATPPAADSPLTEAPPAPAPATPDPASEAVAAQAAEPLIGDASGPEDADPLLDVPTVPAAGASAANEALSGLVPDTRHATVICVANQKGGVGKTTTTVSLGAALAQEGAQVLVVDLDPQGNATTGLGLRAQEGSPSTYRVIVEQMDVEDASEPTAVKGLHVLPSSLDLAGAEIELVPAFSREMRLKNALDAVRDLYDVILIDCPPSLGLLTINAFVAADQVLVPIQCEYYALEGLGQLMRTVKLVSDSLNKELVLGGVVLTMFDGRTNLSQQVVDEVRAYFGETAYQTIVPRTVRLSEAPSYGQPIGVFDPSSRGARSYQRLAREVARRLGVTLESQDVSPLDRLLGTVSSGGPTGTGMAQEEADGRDGALPTDLDEDLADLTEATTTPSSATAPGPDHVERPWSQTAGGSAASTEGER